ncbi:hypothetical protein ACVWZ8_005072 [Arthrobacter sp. UYCu723]
MRATSFSQDQHQPLIAWLVVVYALAAGLEQALHLSQLQLGTGALNITASTNQAWGEVGASFARPHGYVLSLCSTRNYGSLVRTARSRWVGQSLKGLSETKDFKNSLNRESRGRSLIEVA